MKKIIKDLKIISFATKVQEKISNAHETTRRISGDKKEQITESWHVCLVSEDHGNEVAVTSS